MIILNIIGNFVRHILGTIVEIINYYIPNCVGRQHFNDIMRFIGFIIGLLYIQALAVFNYEISLKILCTKKKKRKKKKKKKQNVHFSHYLSIKVALGAPRNLGLYRIWK
jgi:preprotein translocase subunit SecY